MADPPRDPFEPFWLFGLVAAAALLGWLYYGETLVRLAFELKLFELRLIEWVGLGDKGSLALAGDLRRALAAPAPVSFSAFLDGLERTGRYCRAPVCGALIVLGVWLIGFHPAGRFRRRFDLRGLAEAMSEPWPFALHALRRGQSAIPLDDPVWGMALSARAFVERYGLLDATRRGPEAGLVLRQDSAVRILTDQLGGRWTGPGRLAPAAQALAGIFAMRIVSVVTADEAEAARLKSQAFARLRELAGSAARHRSGGYLPPPAAYRRIIQHTACCLDEPAVKAFIAQHAYTHTVLMRLLHEARQGGILAPALFNWLKGVDRPLWYALTTLGRRTPFVEALGAFAHYQAERQAGQALHRPVVASALEALQAALAGRPSPPSAGAP